MESPETEVRDGVMFSLPVIHAGIDVYKAVQRNIDGAANQVLLTAAASLGKCKRGCAHAAVFRIIVLTDEGGNELLYRKCETCDDLERIYYPG